MTLLDFPLNSKVSPDLLAAARQLMSELGDITKVTHLHCSRVIFLSNELGKRCQLSETELQYLRLTACLHDVGKLAIDPAIISKPGSLDDDEQREMREHSAIGSHIISSLGFDDSGDVAIAVRHHHENFNGTGYPDALSGESIPYLSRMVSLIDCYDAISERRSYHRERGKAEVLAIMESEFEKGKFDPYLYNKFIDLVTRKAAA